MRRQRRMMSLLLLSLVLLTAACAARPAGSSRRSAATPAPGATAKPAGPVTIPPAGPTLGEAKKTGGLTAWLLSDPNPPAGGKNQVQVILADDQGQPVRDAKVTLSFDMLAMRHGPNVVEAASDGNGSYSGQVRFVMLGTWAALTTIQRPGQDPVKVTFTFQVGQ